MIRDGTRVASAYGCPSSSHWNGVCRWKPSHDLQYGLGLLVTLAPGVSPHLSMPKRNSGQRRAHAGIEWLYALSLHMYIRRPRLWQQRHGRGEGWWPTSAAFPGPFSCDHYRNYGTFATLWKLRKYQCFYWGRAQKHGKHRDFCYQKPKKHRKYRGFGLPRRKQHLHLRCFFAPSVSKKRKHHLCDGFRAQQNATIRCLARRTRTRTRTTRTTSTTSTTSTSTTTTTSTSTTTTATATTTTSSSSTATATATAATAATTATTATTPTTTSSSSTKMRQKMCYKVRYEKHIILCSAAARTHGAHEQHQCSHYYT